ncbi:MULTISPECIES: tetratricopeptide repeat protein [unclassified Moorena]|uniref:tetratricopeptide repeat protein n=1 Tax=unclassified Moorena TaxID=2683338 RepID=UPI0013FE56D3|nr:MULTISPECIES: tetratricopeptide repeat protein [unclassified Moorena]NEO12801.1 tetratricopeptide repeat protein [Moorena sp. SIO3E8]NEP99576.1 tetratricopeptide repeat protein [Moorena sp. SIO3F7]
MILEEGKRNKGKGLPPIKSGESSGQRQKAKGLDSPCHPCRRVVKYLPIYLLPLTVYLLPLTVSLFPLAFCLEAAQAQTIPVPIIKAFNLLREGRVEEAIKEFEQAVQRYPQSIDAKIGLAIAYRRQGLIDQAWDAYQQVIAEDPTNELALSAVGLFGTYKQEWQAQGIEALTVLLDINPNDTEARGRRALLYGYQQRFGEAIADYEIVLQTDPSPDVLIGAAEVYTYNGNPQRGLELFNQYLATGNVISGYAVLAYAQSLRQTGNAAQAVQVLENELVGFALIDQLDDLGIQTRAALSQAYSENGQISEALAVLEPLQGLPQATLPLARSLNEIRNKNQDPALEAQVSMLYRQALAENPNDPNLIREIADVFTGIPSERATALQLYQQQLAFEPDNRSLMIKIVGLERQTGLISQAELSNRLATILIPLPTEPSELQAVADALIPIEPPGPQFLSIYQNILASGVNAPFLYFRIAQLYIEANDLISARNALATYTATPQGANDLAVQLLAADIERREGNWIASRQRYQALIASNPQRDILNGALQGLSSILLLQDRPGEAVALYDQLVALNPSDVNLQLARATIAYQANLIPESQAEAFVYYWLQTQPNVLPPQELFALVGALPANPTREPLYISLLQSEPDNIPVNRRLIQVIAQRSPELARAQVIELVNRAPYSVQTYLLQGRLAEAIDELDIAERAYQVILTAEPSNTEIIAALGGVRFQQRRFDSAKQLYYRGLAIQPLDFGVRRALVGLNQTEDFKVKALEQLEQLRLEEFSRGSSTATLSRQRQQIQEGFLFRRGFQPPWERFD